MSKIEELLKNEKVEWKRLGEFTEVGTGSSNTNEQVEDGLYPFYVRSKSIKRNNKYEFDDESIVIPGEGGVGDVFHYVNGKYALHQRAYRIHLTEDSISTKFIYYYMVNNFKKYILRNAVQATVLSIRKPKIENFYVPIPSLEIQEKIVKTLDKFTKYVTELQTELQFRLKQYEYYRDMFLSEEYLNKLSENITENKFVEWKKIGELFEFKNGLNKGKEFFGRGTPIVNYTDVYKKNKIYLNDLLGTVETTNDEQERYSVKRGDVFFTRTSETKEEVGKTSVLLEDVENGVFSGFVLRARPKTELLIPEYCAYCFETYEFRKSVVRYSTYTTRALTNGGTLSKLKIPIPSIEIQNHIVTILDKFQDILSDTKGMLPKEIELRQKQYEYYREKLLTFDVDYGRERERESL